MKTPLIQTLSDYDQIPDKYIRKSESSCGRLITVKYSKKAYYEQAWIEYPDLTQARGHTFHTSSGKILCRPFDKLFNFSENGAGLDLDAKNTTVIAAPKINGFFGALTRTQTDQIIIQTSGTACMLYDASKSENDYIRMFAEMISLGLANSLADGYTMMFEVVHPNDPHIMKHEPGIYLIGNRRVSTGAVEQESVLDSVGDLQENISPSDLVAHSKQYGFYRALSCVGTLKSFLDESNDIRVDTEGWMLRHTHGTHICKLKTKSYLSRKFIARMGTKKIENVENIIENEKDEEVAAMIRSVFAVVTPDVFQSMSEPERLQLLNKLSPTF